MEVGRGGGGRLLYVSLYCHHQNDSRIKMGSGKSHFNVSLTVTDKITRQCRETTIRLNLTSVKQLYNMC